MNKLLIVLVLVSASAQAEIYKYQNEKGEWIYSDRPAPNAEKVIFPPLSTYTPAKQTRQTESAERTKPVNVYKSMVFVEPEMDLTIRDNTGQVNVSVRLDPPLKSPQGHKIQYLLDQSPHGSPTGSTKIILKDVPRGAHVIGANVLDAENKSVISADPVTFYIHRKSISHPNSVKRKPKRK